MTLEEIRTFLSDLNDYEFNYNSSEEVIELSNDNSELAATDTLTELGARNEHSLLRLNKSEFPFCYFDTKEEFCSKIKLADFERHIVIRDYEGSPLIFHDGQVYKGEDTTFDTFFWNTKTYLETVRFLISKDSEETEDFEFVDHHNEANTTLTLTSVALQKKIYLKYSLGALEGLSETKGYESNFEELKDCFSEQNKHLPHFIKNSIINKISNYSREDSYLAFLNNLGEIIKEGKLNFNVYLHELSFDKIKSEYDEYKSKYFDTQNSVLSKITNQIIALPISLAGSLFAIIKLKESQFALIVIPIAFLIYVIYLTHIIKFYLDNLHHLKSTVEQDYSKLTSNSFFIEHQDELAEIKRNKNWIMSRSRQLKLKLHSVFIIYWLFNISLMTYCLYLLFDFNTVSIVFWICIFLLLMLISKINILDSSKTNQ